MYIGYKKCQDGRIVKFSISEEYIHNANRKDIVNKDYAQMRCSRGRVLKIYDMHNKKNTFKKAYQLDDEREYWHGNPVKYVVGKIHEPYPQNPGYDMANGRGIHYFLTKTPAFYWRYKPETGLSKSWHENGQRKERYTYEDGKKNGPYKLWYENGQIQESGTYKNNKKDGLIKSWEQTGELREIRKYINGLTINKLKYEDISDEVSFVKNILTRIKQGEDCVDERYDNNTTALMIASEYSSFGCSNNDVRSLIASGAIIDLALDTNTKWTALHCAVAECGLTSSIKTVRILIDAGADVQAPWNKNSNLMHLATTYAKESSSVEAITELAKAGVSINDRDEYDQSPLIITLALSNNSSSLEAARELIRLGADPNGKSKYGLSASAIMLAACERDVELVKSLIDIGAYINYEDLMFIKERENIDEDIEAILIEQIRKVRAGDSGIIIVKYDGMDSKAIELAIQNTVSELRKTFVNSELASIQLNRGSSDTSKDD
jgi:uncharacterized protein DUF5758/ankyrin repeat protein/MORN repeat protein